MTAKARVRAAARIAAVAVALAAVAAMVLLLVHPWHVAQIKPLPLVVGAWLAFAAAVWLLRGVSVRWSVALILLGGIAFQLAAMSSPPQDSDDVYRYIWDGRVQAAGIDPYAYVPTAPQLAGLRNDYLWPVHGPYCVKPGVRDPGDPALTLAAGCTRINRPTVPTIYPPVSEAYFYTVYKLSPASSDVSPARSRPMPMQAAAAACAILLTVLLLFALPRMGRNVRTAALWAWCPSVALEAGNDAHVDVLAVGLTAVALLVLARAGSRRRTVLGGVLLGLAIAAKVTPVLVVPSVLRRRWITVAVAAAGAVAVVYLPHVLAVGGGKVVGYLPGYLHENGYSSGTEFGLIGVLLSGHLATLAAVALLGVTGLLVLRFADPDDPWRSAVVMTAAALAITTPLLQWYALLLVMLVAFDGRVEWLAFSLAGYVAAEPKAGPYSVPHPRVIGYGLAVAFVAAVWLVRLLLARRVPSQPPYRAITDSPAMVREGAPMGVN